MDTLDLVYRVVHIVFGVFWAGAGIMVAAFVVPAVTALGPDGGKFMQRLMGPGRFGLVMTLAGLLTALSGLLMLFANAGGGLGGWLGSSYGRAIVIGSVAGLLALATGLTVNAPTAKRIAQLAHEAQSAGGPPSAALLETMARLRGRLRTAGIVAAILLVIAIFAMAIADGL